jgi:TolB-like protein/DNA-binding winged helix-turn-helix (wHTH) protein/Tfp pilus assembly protein PilF
VSSRKLRFDGWILDPESGDLERGGARIRLQEQPVQVMRELIAHAGSVVSREQLIALLWPKGVVDFDTGLNTVIRKLRSALGDTSDTPRYIETLPRRGYRFIGTLDPDPEAASGASAAMAVSTPSRPSLGLAPALQQEPMVPPEPGLAAPRPMPSEHEPAARDEATPSTVTTIAPVRRPRLSALVLIAALAAAALLTGTYALWRTRGSSVRVEAPPQSALPAKDAVTGAVVFSPPPHSIAVLPFVNISGDKEQDYFSDGLSEELLNSLSRINELQVAARTSSFYFKGEHADLSTIAHKLNVASILEGSVRRSGNTIRVTAQLNNAVTGFHLWSQTYDHDLSNLLQLQTEIANAVASALKVTLLGEVGARLEVGGTRNPAAYDAYLRAESAYWHQNSGSDVEKAITQYSEAVHLDSNFGRAYAGWSIALAEYATYYAQGAAAKRDWLQRARLPAFKAVALTPDLAESHLALAFVHLNNSLDLRRANGEFERAVTLAPGNARILRNYALFAVLMGHTDAGIETARRAAVLDPLNANSHGELGGVLRIARRYEEAMVAYQHAISLDPDSASMPLYIGARIYYAIGNFDEMRSVCERFKERFERAAQNCLALAYHKLGRHADAESALARQKALEGHIGAVDYARAYAQWGDIPKALDWLETAWRLRETNLVFLKSEPLLDPLRQEPRFQAIERELKFPD